MPYTLSVYFLSKQGALDECVRCVIVPVTFHEVGIVPRAFLNEGIKTFLIVFHAYQMFFILFTIPTDQFASMFKDVCPNVFHTIEAFLFGFLP